MNTVQKWFPGGRCCWYFVQLVVPFRCSVCGPTSFEWRNSIGKRVSSKKLIELIHLDQKFSRKHFLSSNLFIYCIETTENAVNAYNHAEAAALKSSNEITNSFDDNLIVIYNRVPKTGSTSFINLAYDLCKKNHFYVLHINITANMHVLSLNNQVSNVVHSLAKYYLPHLSLC